MIIVGVCLMVGSSLVFPNFASARRIKNDTGVFNLVNRYIQNIGYDKHRAAELTESLKELFPTLGQLKSITGLEEKINKLAELIKDKISYSKNIYELSKIARDKKANCYGYVQLVYVLGKAIGLDVLAIEIYSNHTANLINLDSGNIILDLGNESGFYISPVFNWNENYRKDERGKVWMQNEGVKVDKFYKVVQRINEQGIIAGYYKSIGVDKADLARQERRSGNIARVNELYNEAIEYFNTAIRYNPDYAMAVNDIGSVKDDLGEVAFSREDFDKAVKLFEEAIESFSLAIRLNPYYAMAFYNRGLVKIRLGRTEEGIADIREAITLNPDLRYQLPPNIVEKL